MTVEQLIKRLQKMPKRLQVLSADTFSSIERVTLMTAIHSKTFKYYIEDAPISMPMSGDEKRVEIVVLS